MIKTGIVGITGFTGFELLKILLNHPEVEVAYIASRSSTGKPLNSVFPHLDYSGKIEEISEEAINKLDAVFLALPHTVSMEIAGKVGKATKIIDLSADFRIKDTAEYRKWYKKEHLHPELLKEAVYGIPEINRKEIATSRLVANPGCYATAVILALAPVVGFIEERSIIADCKSGVSGAGRSPKEGLQFCEVNENFRAYSIANHRHTPEINQTLSNLAKKEIKVTFTPHLLPVQRGILATVYATTKKSISKKEALEIYREFYSGSPFVRVRKHIPQLHHVRGTNFCDIGLEVDIDNNRLIIVSVLDNLVKGASGQAVQNFNLMFGLRETEGLNMQPFYP